MCDDLDDMKNDPVAFAEWMFGPVEPWQAEVLRELEAHPGKVVVPRREHGRQEAAVRSGKRVRLMRHGGIGVL